MIMIVASSPLRYSLAFYLLSELKIFLGIGTVAPTIAGLTIAAMTIVHIVICTRRDVSTQAQVCWYKMDNCREPKALASGHTSLQDKARG